MKNFLTSQQTAFFTKNGYIEFEFDFDSEALFQSARHALSVRLKTEVAKLSRKSPAEIYAAGRDLWRGEPILRTLLLRKLAPIVQTLANKQSLRLGCDQWIPAHFPWEKASTCKELFSIQGLGLGVLIASAPFPNPNPSYVGLLPLPSKPGNVLFFQPRLILDWPQLANSPPTDLYLALYAMSNSLYIQNPKDPCTNALKQFGYGFGDPLKNEFHPQIL